MKKIAMIAILSTVCAGASAATFNSPHELLVEAIRAGSAKGQMVGSVNEIFTLQFRSDGPLNVSAKTVQILAGDCRRLEVEYRKEGVSTPKGITAAILTTQLNYCLDGSAPATLE